jgi:hypothetical protein
MGSAIIQMGREAKLADSQPTIRWVNVEKGGNAWRDEEHQMPDSEQQRSVRSVYSKAGMCGRYGAGHDVHHIAALKTHSLPQQKGRLAGVERNLLVVDFGRDDFRAFFTHHPQRLRNAVPIGGAVLVPEGHGSILRGWGQCFSLLPAQFEYEPCDQEQPRPMRFRPPTKEAVRPSDTELAAIGPVLVPVHDVIKDWFPLSNPLAREQLAFAIVDEVLRVTPVEGRTWAASIRVEPPEIQPTENLLVEQIHATIRSWFRHHPAAVCWALAEEIVFEVLDADHVVGELWAIHLPGLDPEAGGAKQ